MKKRFTLITSACAIVFTIIFCGFIFNNSGTAKTATGTVFIYQDMDNTQFPPQGWSVSNTAGYDWIRTTYASGYGLGLSSAMCDFYDYAAGNFDMSTNTFTATTVNDTLSFDHAYASGSGEVDSLDVYTSINGGSSWALLISLAGGTSGPLATASPTYNLFVPTSGQWATKKYVLPVGTNKIKFEGVTAFGNNLYLDNIRVGSNFSNDVGLSSITTPKWAITPQSIAPKVNVRNFGSTTQSFNVTMTVNPGGYTNTQNVSNLAPGQTSIVTFANYNFAAVGSYTVKSYTSLAGDQNLSNDTITNILAVTSAPRNVVLEFCTGTWCPWCPCGDIQAHNLSVAYPNAVIFAYHGGSDPWATFNGSSIIGLLGLPGYPSGYIDRRLGPPNNGWGSFFTDAEYRMAQSPSATVNIAQTSLNYNTGTKVLTVNFNATALTTLSGQYKVNFVITEDNLVYSQAGNGYCAANPNAVHNWVVRSIVNTVSGDNVNTGTWNANQVYPLTFTTTLGAAWLSGNCRYNVLIFKDNGALSVSEIQQGSKGYIDLTGINQEGTVIPKTYKLEQNFPNPFNPTTNVHFSIPKDGDVSFKVYNSLGQLVATYFDGFVKAGNYNAEIEAADWASGLYFYTLSTNEFTETKKMILLK